MLTINREQKKIFERMSREKFIDEVFETLPRVFPDDDNVLDKRIMAPFIDEGIDAAASYGITSGRDATLFIYLLIEFGKDFARNEELSWLVKLLTDDNLNQTERMDLIYTRLAL